MSRRARALGRTVWIAAIATVVLPLACLTAPPAEGYRLEGPRAGPTRMPPDGYRWERAGPCRQEMRRNVYQPGVSQPTEVCDFELVPDGAGTTAPSAPPRAD